MRIEFLPDQKVFAVRKVHFMELTPLKCLAFQRSRCLYFTGKHNALKNIKKVQIKFKNNCL